MPVKRSCGLGLVAASVTMGGWRMCGWVRWHDTGKLAHRGLPRKEGLISQRSGANLKPGESGISRKLKLSTFTRSETLILTCIGEVEPLPVFSKSKIQLIYIRKALFFTRLFEIFPQIFPQTPHPPFGIFVFMLP